MTPRRFVVALALFSVCSHVLIHLSAPQLAEVTHRHRRIAKAAAAPALPQSTESPPPLPPLSSLLPPSAAEACSGHHLSVLIVHEHHLKSIGSDLRLMGVLLQLRQLGHSVSFLFRGAVPRSQRSPLTPELARLIGMPDPTNTFEALVLRGGGEAAGGFGEPAALLPPPALYEYGDLGGVERLARHGYFDVVLCSFWFWRDPAPSSAELFLPTITAHSPPDRRPFLAVLADDAHSHKATMMAAWEASEEKKRFWEAKARSLPARQGAVYSLVDAVVHISDADSQVEKAMFGPSCAHWRVINMSPRGFGGGEGTNPPAPHLSPPVATIAAPTADPMAAADLAAAAMAVGATAPRLGFVGNGATPTNHLSIEWFLTSVWGELRQSAPTVRLRLVGLPPNERRKGSGGRGGGGSAGAAVGVATGANVSAQGGGAASPTDRCGWTWGSPWAGRDHAGGIDTLGFLSDNDMESELESWTAMIVPILHSTGKSHTPFSHLSHPIFPFIAAMFSPEWALTMAAPPSCDRDCDRDCDLSPSLQSNLAITVPQLSSNSYPDVPPPTLT